MIIELFRKNNNKFNVFLNFSCYDLRRSSSSDPTYALYFTSEELEEICSFKSHKRVAEYRSSRLLIKQVSLEVDPSIVPKDVSIEKGVFGQLVLSHPRLANYQVSLSHSHGVSGVVIFPEGHPMGIDIEKEDKARDSVIQRQLTSNELSKFVNTPLVVGGEAVSLPLVVFWCAKESLSKVLKTGLTSAVTLYEIRGVKLAERAWESILSAVERDVDFPILEVTFKHFLQYKAIVWRQYGFFVAITLPKYSFPTDHM